MVRSLPARSGLCLPLALLAACVSGPELGTRFVTPANDYLAVESLHAVPHRQGLQIFGRVLASRLRTMPVNAHLHITGTFKDGGPPIAADTRWGAIPVRGSRRTGFSALLRTDHPELIDTITVELRPAQDVRD